MMGLVTEKDEWASVIECDLISPCVWVVMQRRKDGDGLSPLMRVLLRVYCLVTRQTMPGYPDLLGIWTTRQAADAAALAGWKESGTALYSVRPIPVNQSLGVAPIRRWPFYVPHPNSLWRERATISQTAMVKLLRYFGIEIRRGSVDVKSEISAR